MTEHHRFSGPAAARAHTRQQKRTRLFAVLAVALLAAAILSSCGSGSSEPTKAPPTQPAAGDQSIDGATLLDARCSSCHSADVVKSQKQTREQWAQTVGGMVRRGAKLSEAEQATLVEFLAKTYGP